MNTLLQLRSVGSHLVYLFRIFSSVKACSQVPPITAGGTSRCRAARRLLMANLLEASSCGAREEAKAVKA